MTEIIEILFEEVQLKEVIKLLLNQFSTSQLNEHNFLVEDPEIIVNFKSPISLTDLFNKSSDGSFYFNFSKFNLKNLYFTTIGLHLFKYDDKFDLYFCLNHDEFNKIETIHALQFWAEQIAEDILAKKYFCGLEPASDLETRFFTGKIIGPLRFEPV